jgi:cytochrome b6-f complex iron-sulfur subunit
MAEKKKLSVAEILAAARKMDAGRKHGGPAAGASGEEQADGTGEAGAQAAQAAPAAEAAPAVAQPAAAGGEAASPTAASGAARSQARQSGGAAAGGRPSTAEILRMARAQAAAKAGPAKAPAAAAPVGAAAQAASPGSVSPAPAKAVAAAKAAPTAATTISAERAEKETTSFLTPHKPVKRGPISKTEAAVRRPAVAAEPPGKGAAAGEQREKKAVVVPPLPPKPAYAQPKAAPAEQGATRRGFLAGLVMATVGSFLAVGFSSLTATLALWTLGVARFMFPNVLTEPPSRFKVGFPSDFPPGFVDERFKAQFGVWVVNGEYQGQRQIYALRTVCTHLGCTPNWLEAEQKFKCPCHGSGFYKDGINFEGPAPRPLERYAIRLADDGQLEIDKSKLFQEELGQWADPASYVSV